MLTNFQQVTEFNKTFGVKIYDKVDSSIFKKDPKLVEYRLSLIKEEHRELTDAIKALDIIEVVDALLDILYVAYGMGCSFGFNMDSEFADLHQEYYQTTEESLEQTNFQKVVDYCTRQKLIPNDTPAKVLEMQSIVDYYTEIIKGDIDEIEAGIAEEDITNVIYSITQLLYSVYGMGVSLGIDMDEGFSLVHDSNMSKVCSDEQVAKKTVEYYKDAYTSGREPYDTPEYRLSDDKKFYVVYNSSTSKILKSIDYHVVDLVNLVNKSSTN